jgi:hypothetical protein
MKSVQAGAQVLPLVSSSRLGILHFEGSGRDLPLSFWGVIQACIEGLIQGRCVTGIKLCPGRIVKIRLSAQQPSEKVLKQTPEHDLLRYCKDQEKKKKHSRLEVMAGRAATATVAGITCVVSVILVVLALAQIYSAEKQPEG